MGDKLTKLIFKKDKVEMIMPSYKDEENVPSHVVDAMALFIMLNEGNKELFKLIDKKLKEFDEILDKK